MEMAMRTSTHGRMHGNNGKLGTATQVMKADEYADGVSRILVGKGGRNRVVWRDVKEMGSVL